MCLCYKIGIERNSIGVNSLEESAELNGLRGLRKNQGYLQLSCPPHPTLPRDSSSLLLEQGPSKLDFLCAPRQKQWFFPRSFSLDSSMKGILENRKPQKIRSQKNWVSNSVTFGKLFPTSGLKYPSLQNGNKMVIHFTQQVVASVKYHSS